MAIAEVDTGNAMQILFLMSTLVQIESAVADLPPEDQRTLLEWLQVRLAPVANTQASETEALKLFRQLQEEVGLTQEGATAWKNAVVDARR